MTPRAQEVLRFHRREMQATTLPPVTDLVEAINPIHYAYSTLIRETSDLMDYAMKGPISREDCAILLHMMQAMSERCLVVKQLAETRLERFVNGEGAQQS